MTSDLAGDRWDSADLRAAVGLASGVVCGEDDSGAWIEIVQGESVVRLEAIDPLLDGCLADAQGRGIPVTQWPRLERLWALNALAATCALLGAVAF